MFKLPAKYKNVYLIGIKGVGMTMLAQFLQASGAKVSGSDVVETFLTDKVLRQAKIKVHAGFDPKNIPSPNTTIIYSSAYTPENNIELAFLEKKHDWKLLSYATALGEIFSAHHGVAVIGSHGKTTTSAWLGYVLDKAGLEPSILVGSSVPQLGGSAKLGKSDLFIAEVDEYQNKLQYFQPVGAVLNNIDYDHPDFFPTKSSYFQAFANFVAKIPTRGFLVTNDNDSAVRRTYPYLKGKLVNYNLFVDEASAKAAAKRVRLAAYDYRLDNGWQYFKVYGQGEFKTKLLGRHNVFNALAVIGAALELEVPLEVIKKHLTTFKGTTRRAQLLGKYQGVPIFDDYAHHPTEIKATLSTFAAAYKGRRLVAVFHPHTFSRTKALFKDFARSFAVADLLVVLDIYGSAREEQGGVSSSELIEAIKEVNKTAGRRQTVIYQPDLEATEKYLRANLKPNDLVVLLGAGDIFRVGQNLVKKTRTATKKK
ncbi:MAG: UDP-N-acetylmuramate--L-alanine ligase [Patescibacteria group bacterium]|jgi:UDP-N-acetylmuramate--alanine ligase